MKPIFLLSCLAATIGLAACSAPAASVPAVKQVQLAGGGAYTNAGPAQLKQMLSTKDFLFVNVHIPYEGEIDQTDLFIAYDQVEQNLERLPADKSSKIFLYCRSGHMSRIAAEKLVQLGYSNVWNLEGGMAAWQEAGWPVLQRAR